MGARDVHLPRLGSAPDCKKRGEDGSPLRPFDGSLGFADFMDL
jgi:hypothetical protein